MPGSKSNSADSSGCSRKQRGWRVHGTKAEDLPLKVRPTRSRARHLPTARRFLQRTLHFVLCLQIEHFCLPKPFTNLDTDQIDVQSNTENVNYSGTHANLPSRSSSHPHLRAGAQTSTGVRGNPGLLRVRASWKRGPSGSAPRHPAGMQAGSRPRGGLPLAAAVHGSTAFMQHSTQYSIVIPRPLQKTTTTPECTQIISISYMLRRMQ